MFLSAIPTALATASGKCDRHELVTRDVHCGVKERMSKTGFVVSIHDYIERKPVFAFDKTVQQLVADMRPMLKGRHGLLFESPDGAISGLVRT